MKVKSPKKYFIKTFGCQANVADSQNFAEVLKKMGLKEAPSPKDCDVLVVNTCSVRQKSEDKVYGLAKVLKGFKQKPFVVLAGCMVGSAVGDRKRYSLTELKKKVPWADEFIKPGDVEGLAKALGCVGVHLVGTRHGASPQDGRGASPRDSCRASLRKGGSHAYINISTGCDNFCSFCVVPYARGEEVSRPKQEILEEIRNLVKSGVSEVTLCAQNVNSWGLGKKEKFEVRVGSNQKLPFAGLLREVHAIAGIKKIEFLSSNPFDFTDDLIKVLKLPKISNYVHIAVQSGNNDILKRMNRRHTVEEFVSLIDKIKKVRPDMRFGTDIIVGFPGETKDQFIDTVKLFKDIKFDVAYISVYSERQGTSAAKMYEDDVPLAEKKRRHAYLTKVWKDQKR